MYQQLSFVYFSVDILLEEYKGHSEGPNPTTKLKENVASKIYRIKKFLAYMAQGESKLGTFLFLDNTQKIRL